MDFSLIKSLLLVKDPIFSHEKKKLIKQIFYPFFLPSIHYVFSFPLCVYTSIRKRYYRDYDKKIGRLACVKIAYKDHPQPPTAQVSSVQDYVKSSTIVYR